VKSCEDHWAQLRAAVGERGLDHLVAKDGKAAAEAMMDELESGPTPANFDPLMASYWAICSNAMEISGRLYGRPPMFLMIDHPEQPELECPICALNFLHAEHDRTCSRADCDWPKGER
jgi:hypothetical protein